MKIIYNQNPLNTVVELDDHEKKELWYKIKIDELEEKIQISKFHLTNDKYYNLEEAKSYLEIENIDKRCDQLLLCYIEELAAPHCGDCVCFPCACAKCYAESLLGIDTIKGLSKHSANKIEVAFAKNTKDIDSVIEYLNNYEPILEYNPKIWISKENYEKHIPRWKGEAKQAAEWLLNYKQTYLMTE